MIKHILVADDDRSTAMLVARRLEREGFRVTTVDNGLSALEIIRREPVDLLITDVVMPEMDGVDLYMELKNSSQTASVPIIIVTDKEVFQKSFAALGVDLFVPKPSDFNDLMAQIRTIEKRHAETHRFHKVVLVGPSKDVLESMSVILREKGCLVTMVDNVIDITSKSMLFNPRIMLFDIATRDYATAKEIIRSLRCYDFFRKTIFLVYASFSPKDIADGGGVLEHLDTEIKDCLAAGANKYIGRFNRVTFLESLAEYGIV
ncbi:MAG: response regulator [Candidatus Omnitrophica bacterium]|nr:response regulator [Candidatus Omnitrophota bacterium]